MKAHAHSTSIEKTSCRTSGGQRWHLYKTNGEVEGSTVHPDGSTCKVIHNYNMKNCKSYMSLFAHLELLETWMKHRCIRCLSWQVCRKREGNYKLYVALEEAGVEQTQPDFSDTCFLPISQTFWVDKIRASSYPYVPPEWLHEDSRSCHVWNYTTVTYKRTTHIKLPYVSRITFITKVSCL